MIKRFGSVVVMREEFAAIREAKESELLHGFADLAKRMSEELEFEEIPTIMDGHKTYAINIVVLSPAEYKNLKGKK